MCEASFETQQQQCVEHEIKTTLSEIKTRSQSLRLLGFTLPRIVHTDFEKELEEDNRSEEKDVLCVTLSSIPLPSNYHLEGATCTLKP